MLAAVVEKPGELVIKDIPRPVVTKGTFLLKTNACSICNATDNHILHGMVEGYHDFYPQVLGHEVCGTVIEIGIDVDDVKLGDRISLYTPNGAFAEYVLVTSDDEYAHVPDGLSDEVASICEMCDGAYRNTVACAELKPDEKVLVVGAGPMGLTSAAFASAAGAKVAVIDFYQNRLDKAIELGAAFVCNHSGKTADEVIKNIVTEFGPIDTAFVCIALDISPELDTFYIPIECLRPGGRITSLNVSVKPEYHNHRLNPYHMNKKNIKFRHMLEREGLPSDFQRGYDLVAEGKVHLEKLITHRITFSGLQNALEMCDKRLDECIKVVVEPRL